jgi:hypothetical protein
MIAIKIRAVLFLKLSINSNFYLFDTFLSTTSTVNKQFEKLIFLAGKIPEISK